MKKRKGKHWELDGSQKVCKGQREKICEREKGQVLNPWKRL